MASLPLLLGIQMTTRKRSAGWVLFLLGAALVTVAALALLADDSDSGDVAAIESVLRPADPQPVQLGPPPTTSSTLPPTSPDDTEPSTATLPPDSQPVAVAAPVGLRIDSLDVDAPVEAYGVNERTGQMAVPDNVTDVGWYRFGPSPGEPGSAVMAAHVDLASSGPGVFFDLETLDEGDRIEVLHADGTETPFLVVARVKYQKDELPLDVIFSREGPAVLTLITCGGAFNSEISRYDSNVVVYAVPLPVTKPVERPTL